MLENDFQKDVIKAVEAKCAFVINIHGHAWQKSGLPDLHIMHKNWTGWLELKCENYEASTIQRITAAKIQLRGISAWVLRCRTINIRAMSTYSYAIHAQLTLETFGGEIVKQVPTLEELLDVLVEVEGRYHDEERQLALEIKKLQTTLTNTRLSNSAGWHDLVQENDILRQYKDYSYYVGGEITCKRMPLKYCAWVDLMKQTNQNNNNNDNDNSDKGGPVCAPWLRQPK